MVETHAPEIETPTHVSSCVTRVTELNIANIGAAYSTVSHKESPLIVKRNVPRFLWPSAGQRDFLGVGVRMTIGPPNLF